MSGAGEYEDGDVNVLATGYEDADVNVTSEYEEGDINAVHEDAGYEDEERDVAVRDVAAREVVGNQVAGGTPGAILGYLARSLANEPDFVVVDVEERPGSVRLHLHVGPEDMGRVIGRRGRTAQAIRTLVGVAGARDGVQTSVDIVDD